MRSSDAILGHSPAGCQHEFGVRRLDAAFGALRGPSASLTVMVLEIDREVSPIAPKAQASLHTPRWLSPMGKTDGPCPKGYEKLRSRDRQAACIGLRSTAPDFPNMAGGALSFGSCPYSSWGRWLRNLRFWGICSAPGCAGSARRSLLRWRMPRF